MREPRRLKQLEEENVALKRLVADLSLDKRMLQKVLKKVWGPRANVRWRSGCAPYSPSANAEHAGCCDTIEPVTTTNRS